MRTFDISCGMFSNVIISNAISLILRDSDIESEKVSLIWGSVSEGKFKECIIDRCRIKKETILVCTIITKISQLKQTRISAFSF